MNIEWLLGGNLAYPSVEPCEHYAYVDGKLVGRVMPWYLPEGRYVYAAEVHTPQVVVFGDFNTADEAKQAVEDAVKGAVMNWRLVVEDDSYGGTLAHLALFGTSSEPIAALYDHDTYWSAWVGEDYGGEFSTLELAKRAVEAHVRKQLGGGNAT